MVYGCQKGVRQDPPIVDEKAGALCAASESSLATRRRRTDWPAGGTTPLLTVWLLPGREHRRTFCDAPSIVWLSSGPSSSVTRWAPWLPLPSRSLIPRRCAVSYCYPTARADVALASPPAIPVLGDALRYTVSPLVGRALLPAVIKGMLTPCDVPADFAEDFPLGMAVQPSQIRASSQDAAAMIPAAAAMRHRYRQLSMPLVIMAGREDKVAEVGRQSVQLHEEIPHSSIRLVANVGHMLHYAVPEEVVAAIETVSGRGGGAAYRHDRTEEATSLS
jgi:hypothetical protein